MAQFEKHFVQDLQQDIKIRQCGTIVFNADNESNVVSVDLYNGSEAYTGGGVVAGAVICPDGATVMLTGELSGNTASITLTGDCFALPGQIGVGIQIVNEDVKTTVLKAIFNVEMVSTDEIVDPDSRITASVAQLVQDIEDAIDTFPADLSGLLAAIARSFNRNTSYSAGDYVWYYGGFYRFTADKAPGNWNPGIVEDIHLADAVAAISAQIGSTPMGTTATTLTGAIAELKGGQDDLKSAVTNVQDDFYGEDVADFSVVLSNNNTALTNNNDGTYSIGTNDYGTTVFAEQLTLTPGEYLLNSVPVGRMVVSTSTSPNNGFIEARTTPTKFTIDENTSCYLLFRMDAMASSATTIEPFIKNIGLYETVKNISGTNDAAFPWVDLTSEFVSGGYINTSVSVGSAITFKPTVNSGSTYNVQNCKKGDMFEIAGLGGVNSRLWAFVNDDFEVVSQSSESVKTSGLILVAPADGFLIVNAEITSTKKLQKRKTNSEADYVRITNPHKLNWVMKSFNASGVGTALYTDRMCTWCRVKAGSTIIAPTTGGVNISFGYKVDDSSEELDHFQSYAYGTVGVTQECTIYIGVLYNTPAFIPNDSLLDNLTFDLRVVDYKNKYSKKGSCAFGNPVDIYYEGQHTDETGWTNETVDIDAIHAEFHALSDASNGYIAEKDLGVVYDTYHMYQYDTFPVPVNYGSLKVPKIAIICCEHGNEKMSVYAVHYLLHDLLYKSTNNPALSYLKSNCKLSIIPIANPYGFLHTSRLNEHDVNLNRNFPTYNWDDYNDETSVDGGINYKGTAPASEEQTKKIIEFLRSNYDAVFAIDLHTNGENTSAPYEISATIIPEDPDHTSDAYAVQDSYVVPAKVYTNRIKPWFDEKYNVNIGPYFYGAVTVEPDRPTTAQWIRESNNMMGITFELLCGSSSGYLGPTLTKYDAATIKAAAEELGNFLLAMLIHCKDA